MKKSVFVLNCCPLGGAELQFWNALFERHDDEASFKFFSTEVSDELRLAEVIPVNYGWTVFDNAYNRLSSDWQERIRGLSELDRVWGVYDDEHSLKLCASWLVFWDIFIKYYQPHTVIIWNGYHVPEATLAEVAPLYGCNVLFAERGPLGGTFVLDPQGINVASEFVRAPNTIKAALSDAQVHEYAQIYAMRGATGWSQPTRTKGREEFRRRLGLKSDLPLMLFAGQVEQDSNAHFHSPHFSTNADAARAVIEAANRQSHEFTLIVKRHPKEPAHESLEGIEIENGALIDDAHIIDCITYSDAVISVNSATSVEAALMGKPCLVLGRSILDASSRCIRLADAGQLDDALTKLLAAARNNEDIRDSNFFSRLLGGYLYSGNPEDWEFGLRPPKIDLGGEDDDVTATQGVVGDQVNLLSALIPRDWGHSASDHALRFQLESSYAAALQRNLRTRAAGQNTVKGKMAKSIWSGEEPGQWELKRSST